MTPWVKICGLTREEDALLAVELGARALGFIFYPPSPRGVEPEHAARIIAALPPHVLTVGVFVQAGAERINAVAAQCRLDRVQLHGGEPFAALARLSRPGYRAFRLKDEADVAAVEATPDTTVLLDTFRPEQYGGTGRQFDWRWAQRLNVPASAAGAEPMRPGRRVILSGGLTPDNVAEAVQAVHPYAVDLASGVEARPGIKDPALLRALFQALATVQGSTAPALPLTPSADHAPFAN